MIKIKQMVRLKINSEEWIGQVMDIENDIALIQLFENMHYHAHVSELTPITASDVRRRA
jgi:vacuolar-type H+-ATPase catalytic subunit A/Vma1